MEKDIRFTGYTAVPSDYECSDGELTQAYNLINEDGAYKSLLAPKVVFNLGESHKVIYVHKATTYTHYIIQDTENTKLLWTNDGKNFTDLYSLTNGNKLYQVVGVGNTLIILTSDGMHYILWKGQSGDYLYLGTHLPELPISFGLQAEVVKTDNFTLNFNNIDNDKLWDEFDDNNKKIITQQMLAKVNKFITDKSTKAGKFIYPFFVRYAYRLYDGTLTMHSSPVLMICSTDLAPQAVLLDYTAGRGTATVQIFAPLHQLDYAVINKEDIDSLRNWEDIVKSVDVFISKPIYTYDQNGECERFVPYESSDCECVCKHINPSAAAPAIETYRVFGTRMLYARTFNDGTSYPPARVMLPHRNNEQIKADIRSCGQFYFLNSIKIDELKTLRTVIDVEQDYLTSLVTKEIMTDDYDSHDRLLAKYAFSYNQRLNICNIQKKLYSNYDFGAFVTLCDANIPYFTEPRPAANSMNEDCTVYFFIRQDGKEITVGGKKFYMNSNAPVYFLYYPNTNCYKAVIVRKSITGVKRIEVPMEAHGFLNGAFYFEGWDNAIKEYIGAITPMTDSERSVSVENKIYTSEVNNPFYFPVTNINTVGTGRVLGISTAAKPLSQGQFGQFPLYAFTDDGVWALEVNASGGYSAKQPITRDVCISSDSITQIDSAVLFATDRGIMEISGSQTQCITDIINGDEYFSLDRLPGLSKLYPDGIPKVDCTFSEYRKSARMAYDYVNQRIIVFNTSKKYAYVFSMKSKLWGFVASSLTSAINSYPNAYAMAQVKTIEGEDKKEVINNCLVDISHSEETHHKGLLVTRPIKLEAGSMLKTFDTVFIRGLFGKGKVQAVLYGSRDNIRWHLIHSAKEHYLRGFRGTPYKYFRIVAITDLSIGETLVGASVAYTPRLTNQIR